MASILIEKATVTKSFASGFWCQTAKKTYNGEDAFEKWTCWTQKSPNVGDVVNVRGELTVRLEKFNNDQGDEVRYARGHVNEVEWSLVTAAEPVSPSPAAEDPWANYSPQSAAQSPPTVVRPDPFDTDTPF